MAWVAEENFNSLSDGDLNGQGGGSGWSGNWSGGTPFDVQGTTVKEGAKAVSAVNANASIDRTLTTATTSGVVYFAMRCTAMSSDAQTDFKVGASVAFRISFRNTDNIEVLHNGTTEVILNGFSTSVWYVFEVTYNGTTFTVRFHDGTSWSSSFGSYNYYVTGDITKISFNHGGSQTVYHDQITATNPTSTSITVNPSAQVDTFSIPSYSVLRGWVTSPSAQVATFSTPSRTISLPKVVSVSPQVATFSIPAYDVIMSGVIVHPSAQTVTFSIPAYQVKTYSLVMPNGQTLTFSVPAYTIVVEANITISPNTLVLTLTTPSRAKVGAVWVKRGRSTNATWERSTRNSN